MTAPHRRAAASHRRLDRSRLAVPTALALVAALAIGCGSSTPTTTPSPPSSSAITTAPSLTPVPGGSAASGAPAPPVSQTNTSTEVGRIWDALPPSFPRIAGAVPIEVGAGPTSGTFAVGTDLATAVATIRAGLAVLGYNVDVGSPLEDGSVVLDAGGGGEPECRIEVRFTPLSGTITMAVLYGAACPFN